MDIDNNNDNSDAAAAETNPQPSFLHSKYKAENPDLKSSLPKSVWGLENTDMVLLYKETENEEMLHYKVCNFANDVLFTALLVKEIKQFTSHGLSRQESFQYLRNRFERNDPLVIKPRRFHLETDTEIQCPGGKVLGYSVKRQNGSTIGDVRDSMETLLYTVYRSKSSGCCSCLSGSGKSKSTYQIRKSGEAKPVCRITLSQTDKPHIVTFPDNLSTVYKAIFTGSALSLVLNSPKKR